MSQNNNSLRGDNSSVIITGATSNVLRGATSNVESTANASVVENQLRPYASDDNDPSNKYITTVKYNTTEYWESIPDYIPEEGEFIVYSDCHEVQIGGETVCVPDIKIGDGETAIAELPFISDYSGSGPSGRGIFWATYGETTYGEIMQASSQEKKVCCKYNGMIYDLVYAVSYCLFACTDNIVSPAIVRFLRVETSSVWSASDTGALAAAAFVAVEFSTSFADINAAIDAGREVLCLGPGGYAHLIHKTTNYISFATLPNSGYNGASRQATVDSSNNWTYSYVGFELDYDTTNKKLRKTYGSSYYDVVTAVKMVEDGVATANLISQEDFNAIFD